MITSAAEFVRLRSSEDPAEYRRAAWEPAADEVWLAVIRDYPEYREWVAHNKTVSGEILALLAQDDDPRVRFTVAMRRAATPEILRALASDPDESVRLRVAGHPKVPADALRQLASDEWVRVREVASKRLHEAG